MAPDPRREIEDFLNDYAFAIDDGDYSRWPDFFTADAVYQIIPRESHEAGYPVGVMYCEGQGMMRDRIDALQEANIFEPHTYCHFLGRPGLQLEDDGSVLARTNFQVIRTMQDGRGETFAVGKYLDRLQLDSDAPLLRERRVILESRRIDILLVFPL